MYINWNPWHGCHKISPGCLNCYVYRRDEKYELLASKVKKNATFDLPIKKYKNGDYKFPANTFFWTCFTSDFFLEDVDDFREDAWKIIKERSDCHFFFITKRIDRFMVNLPNDWNDGYNNVTIGCTVENQDRADYRLPYFLKYPIKHRLIICEPLLEAIDLEKYLSEAIDEVNVGGESGMRTRPCNYEWILSIREQCFKNNVNFTFRQTGARFIKEGKMYRIARKYQHSQANKANINLFIKMHNNLEKGNKLIK